MIYFVALDQYRFLHFYFHGANLWMADQPQDMEYELAKGIFPY